MKAVFEKYKEPILYIFFGVLTTVVNFVSYMILVGFFGGAKSTGAVLAATAVAQVLAVLFAYVTNRRWVFKSKAYGSKAVVAEAAKFFACRGVSFVLDILLMYVGVSVLLMNDSLVKIGSNVIIIALNYLLSKFFVFKK